MKNNKTYIKVVLGAGERIGKPRPSNIASNKQIRRALKTLFNIKKIVLLKNTKTNNKPRRHLDKQN